MRWGTSSIFQLADATLSYYASYLSTFNCCWSNVWFHYSRLFGYFGHYYSDVIMGAMVSQITSLTIVYSTVYSGADQRKHQRSASLAFVRGIHRSPVNSPHKGQWHGKCFHFVTSSWRTVSAQVRRRMLISASETLVNIPRDPTLPMLSKRKCYLCHIT